MFLAVAAIRWLGISAGLQISPELVMVVPLAFAMRHWRGYVVVVLWPGSTLIAVAGLLWFIKRAFDMAWALPI